MKKLKLTAFLCAAAAAAAMLSGCGKNPDVSGESQTETTEAAASAGTGDEGDTYFHGETRPIEEGDDYAINKINCRTQGDTLPGGYSLIDYNEEKQGKFYVNGKSQIVIRSYNYKEDLQDLAIWADQACAITKVNNIVDACDTFFSEPENTTCLGFDAIKYNYEVVQYEFLNETDDKGNKIKNPIGTYKGIAYYLYSDQDAYAILFDTAEADWDEQSANFEAFMNDLEITPTEY